MKKFYRQGFFLLSMFYCMSARLVFSQPGFYDLHVVQEINMVFTQPNWSYQLDTSKNGNGGYIIAAQVQINGINFDSVGVKYKGTSSYSLSQTKNPFHLSLDFVKSNQDYQGYSEVKLGNGWSDPSSVREVLSYEILRNYMDAPQSNFARVFINGNYQGLYSNTEDIGKKFAGDHFYSSSNTLIKCNPWIPGLYWSDLVNLGQDSSLYFHHYDLKSDYGWNELVDLCDTLENYSGDIHRMLDVDRTLWMLAFNNVTVNLDSYTGAFAQNYYLCRDDNGRFNPVIWDLNMCFGGFGMTGSGPPLSISTMQNMPPMLHDTNSLRPLISRLLANATYRHMYVAHMKTILNEFFGNNLYQTLTDSCQNLIDSSVQIEPYGLYTYLEFQQSLTTNIGTGPLQIPGIYNLMGARVTYLNNTPEFQQQQPLIGPVSVVPSTPSINDSVWFTCNVANASAVKLGYRYFTPYIFNRIDMFDDGNHQDGAAGDQVFGVAIPASSASLEYYVYAESAIAGIFSPERAEHEFYHLQVNTPLASPGSFVINEFLALNNTGATDAQGEHDDWIELFNKTATDIPLAGFFLSDDPSNPGKWPFPANTVLPANGYLTVWADEDQSLNGLHCNFKLSGNGESLILSDLNSLVHDSIAFGLQSPDVSQARCPDGTGPFNFSLLPSLGATNNCNTGVDVIAGGNRLHVFPNPASGVISIFADEKISRLALYNPLGVLLIQQTETRGVPVTLDLSALGGGVYLLRINDEKVIRIIKI